MNRIKFSESITIYCSAQVVFNYTQDYQNRLKWDTFLKQADLMEGLLRLGFRMRAFEEKRSSFEDILVEVAESNRRL